MGPKHPGDRNGDVCVPNSFPRYVATPLAGLLNVKEKVRLKATPNAVLEKFYAATSKHPKQVRAGGSPEVAGTGRVAEGGCVTRRGCPGVPRPTWRRCPRRAAAPCARSSAGSAAAATRTGPACSRSSGRPGETPVSLVSLSLPLGAGRVAAAGPGAGGSVLLPPAPRCPSEDRLLPFSSWRFTFYLIAFIAGMAVIVDVSISPAPCAPPALPAPLTALSPPPHPAETLVLRPAGGVEGIPHPGERGSRPGCRPAAFPELQERLWGSLGGLGVPGPP